MGVKILMQNPKGEFLLIRRSPKKYPEVGPRWDIVGGRINPGSTLIENLKREVKEETRLDLICEPELVAAQDILRIAGRHVVRLTYFGTVEGEPILDEDHSEYKWFKLKEILNLPEDEVDIYFREILVQKGKEFF